MSVYKDENEKWFWFLILVVAVLLILAVKFKREVRKLRKVLDKFELGG